MKNACLWILMLATSFLSTRAMLLACHDSQTAAEKEALLRLPIESPENQFRFDATAAADDAASWQRFRAQNGEWTILLDPASGSPRQAVGPPIAIRSFDAISAANVEAAARRFLSDNAATFAIDPSTLTFRRANRVQGKWYVSFRQQYQGLEVLFAEVELRMRDDAKVFAFRIDGYPGIELDSEARIPIEEAARTALEGLAADHKSACRADYDPLQSTRSLAVLPIKQGHSIEYRLVYRLPLLLPGAGTAYQSLVDAHSGELLRRTAQHLHVATTIGVKGDVRTRSALEPTESVELPNLYVTVGGQRHTTDDKGNLSVDIEAEASVNATLEGPFGAVLANGRESAAWEGSLSPGEDMTIFWNDDNSHRYERNMFSYLNRIHAWVKAIDPELTTMDQQISVELWWSSHPQFGEQANAFSNGNQIAFLGLSDENIRMADGGSVFYHEYGHSINTLVAEDLGGSFDNPTLQEGIADVVTAFVTDDPLTGPGVFADDPERFIRTAENSLVYPDDIQGESHHDGQIISGAFWDLRKLTSLATATKLAHFARYGLPDDPDNGVAFSEWFMETLIADDDDGDLSNGTPHCAEIVQAFNNHQIGTLLSMRQSFAHSALANTLDTLNPYPVEFSFESFALKGTQLDSVILTYSSNRDGDEKIVKALALDGGKWQAAIPAQKPGTIVSYQISVFEPATQKLLPLSPAVQSADAYRFLVGFQRAAFDNLSSGEQWTLGVQSGDFFGAGWEIGDPQAIDLADLGAPFSQILQPEDDHSDDNAECLVTGAGSGFNIERYMVAAGQTTALSPIYDLSAYSVAVLQYFRWFSVLAPPFGNSPDPIFRVEMSGDGGLSWREAEEISGDHGEWIKVLLTIPEDFQRAEQFQLRFIVENPSGNGQFGALANALVDDIEILGVSADRATTSVANQDGKVPMPAIWIAPNPIVNQAQVKIELPQNGEVRLSLRDLLGREIQLLHDGNLPAGAHAFYWDRDDKLGQSVEAGVYFVRMNFEGRLQSKQLIVR